MTLGHSSANPVCRPDADGFIGQKNFLLNVTEFVRRQVPATWAGALRGLPAFVCGSGPSLDESAAALAPVADRGVVFAADSALRALARHGIVADFAVSVSPAKPAELCLAPEAGPRRVILSSVSPVSWREAIAPDRRYFLSRRHPTEDWLAEQGAAPTPVVADENCGLTELELARFLGCAPIHLFGLDFAIDATHAPAHHSVDADPALARPEISAALTRVPGNYAAEVPAYLFADWQECDTRLSRWPADLVINVNDRGARLRQTRLTHPRQFVLAAGGGSKRPALAQLAPPVLVQADAVQRALTAIGAQGARGCRLVAGLRAMLVQQGGAALAEELRRVCADRDFARTLGAFAPKILRSIPAGDDTLWLGVLDEFEELCCLAEAVYGAALG